MIGGTSAGAAIMTRVMIVSGRKQAVEGLGFDLFPNTVVDQHFLKRKRMDRLMGLLGNHPNCWVSASTRGPPCSSRGTA